MGKCKLYVVFGREAVKAAMTGDAYEFSEILGSQVLQANEYIKIREFETEGERNAYIQALDDFDGFMDFATLNPQCSFDQSIINEIDKRYA